MIGIVPITIKTPQNGTRKVPIQAFIVGVSCVAGLGIGGRGQSGVQTERGRIRNRGAIFTIMVFAVPSRFRSSFRVVGILPRGHRFPNL